MTEAKAFIDMPSYQTKIALTSVSEFYRIVFCRNIYKSLDELRRDLDTWTKEHSKIGSALSHYIPSKDSLLLMEKNDTLAFKGDYGW